MKSNQLFIVRSPSGGVPISQSTQIYISRATKHFATKNGENRATSGLPSQGPLATTASSVQLHTLQRVLMSFVIMVTNCSVYGHAAVFVPSKLHDSGGDITDILRDSTMAFTMPILYKQVAQRGQSTRERLWNDCNGSRSV